MTWSMLFWVPGPAPKEFGSNPVIKKPIHTNISLFNMHIMHLKFINHNQPECRIIWMDFRCWLQVQVKEKMTFTFFFWGVWCRSSLHPTPHCWNTLYNNLPLFLPIMQCLICLFGCFFLSPSVYFLSLLGIFSFSHRCKFFSLTETPENYTVVLDEEGFKGKIHLNCCPESLLCSLDNATHIFMEYNGKYIILFIVMLSPYTIVPGYL